MGLRPDRATTVYANCIRQVYKDIPIIAGGIEASLRRLAHYDYWDNRVRASLLHDSGVDLLLYGMGERSIVQLADALQAGIPIKEITYIDGSVYQTASLENVYDYIRIDSFEAVRQDKEAYARAFLAQYRNQDPLTGKRIVQPSAICRRCRSASRNWMMSMHYHMSEPIIQCMRVQAEYRLYRKSSSAW